MSKFTPFVSVALSLLAGTAVADIRPTRPPCPDGFQSSPTASVGGAHYYYRCVKAPLAANGAVNTDNINKLIADANWRFSETPVVRAFGAWGALYCGQVKE